MSRQLVFSGEAGCPTFTPHTFKLDMCRVCRNKIQSHSEASEPQVYICKLSEYVCGSFSFLFVLQIFAAMEYSIPSIPSLIWESLGGRGSLYLGESCHTMFAKHPQIKKVIKGGYKAAINTDYLVMEYVSKFIE